MKQAQAFINVSEVIAWTVVAIGVSYSVDIIIKQVRKVRISKGLPKPEEYSIKYHEQASETKQIKGVNLEKMFNGIIVFNAFNLSFDSSSITFIKGTSGKGKTTLLRLFAGIEKADSGTVIYSDVEKMGYAFQDIRLLPWLTVSKNITFALNKKHIDKQEISNLLAFLLEKMELSEHGYKFPHELSGGQQQRVGLARALAAKSDVLLLDEPLTGLDNELKVRITAFLKEWIAAYRPMVVWATHEKVQMRDLEIREVIL